MAVEAINESAGAAIPQSDELQQIKKNALEIEMLQHQLQVSKVRLEVRVKYEPRLFWFTVAWCIIVLGLLLFQAFHIYGFSLPNLVLMMIVGSTTANVYCFQKISLKYFFSDSTARKWI